MRQAPDIPDLVPAHNAPVGHLGADVQLLLRAGILQPVGPDCDQVPRAQLPGREGHGAQHLADLDGHRLQLPVIEGGPLITHGLVLQHILIDPEIVKNVRLNDLLLIRVQAERLLLQLLNVLILKGEKQDSSAFPLQVQLVKPLPLFRHVLRIQHVVHPGHEPESGAVFDALLDALVLYVQQLHGWPQRLIPAAHDVIIVLMLGQDPAAGHLHVPLLSGSEGVFQPRFPVHVQDSDLRGQRWKVPDRLRVLRIPGPVQHRQDERGSLHLQDGGQPVKELAPRHEAVRAAPDLRPELLLCAALYVHAQLGSVPRDGVDGRPHQQALIQGPVPRGEHRRVGRQGFENPRGFLPRFLIPRAAKDAFKHPAHI